ncbi:hydroxymethylpyrimidine/phosphomethylpyrimidine kinase [Marinobacter sp. CHS3-4]|uniref:bifunctional hydroxymethylpyrimidine kinase/phosphomethylpyrimidine kinase n=1 Tax=Marinobacter sp. CHS3-4 TaxID=3045174 RepID=UPI0024B52468|nr:hydroxymethylpyrimidine/phosphomethylpyrimidine kinase [Marinobacter sp. CHS3-4]MDI9246603.1 hydroxymethylpyrimidine/phosphomethylpyrimidine kinase [Marinobacter sp. CHS3-4]
MKDLQTRPQVLVISGLDPSGGAGIQADIQAITALGCHPLPVLSCLTVQDTKNVYGASSVDPDMIRQQLAKLAEDCPIHAIKTGAMGSADIVDVLVEFLADHPGVPLITDPVIKAAGGGDLADEALIERMKSRLFAHAEILTPNGIELELLGNSSDPLQAANNVLETGCHSVIATGGHGTGEQIINTLYRSGRTPKEFKVDRVRGEHHGTGCTLAASIAAGRASGLKISPSIGQAQNFVSHAIRNALRVGKGQPVPDRGIQWEQ